MSGFTKKDSKELGIPLSLLQQWEKLMDALMQDCCTHFKKVYSPPNEIKVGDMLIRGLFFNNEYIQLTIEKNGTTILELRHNDKHMELSKLFTYMTLCVYQPSLKKEKKSNP